MTLESTLRDMARSLRTIAEKLEGLATEQPPVFPVSSLQLEILITLAEAKVKSTDALSSRDIATIITDERRRKLTSTHPTSRTFGASVARAAKYLLALEMILSTKIGRRVLYSLARDIVVISGKGNNLPDAFSSISSRDRQAFDGQRSQAWIILETDASLTSQGLLTKEDVLSRACEVLKALGLGATRPNQVIIRQNPEALHRNAVHIVARLEPGPDPRVKRRRSKKAQEGLGPSQRNPSGGWHD